MLVTSTSVLALGLCLAGPDGDRVRVATGATTVDTAVSTLANGVKDLEPALRRLPVRGADGLEIVQVGGTLSGVPLAQPIATLLVERDDHVRLVVVTAPIDQLVDPTPHLPMAQALAVLERSGLPGSVGATHADLVAVPAGPHARLVWRVDPPLDRHDLQNLVFLIDAHSGAIFVAGDRVRMALARSFFRNPVLDPVAENYDLNAIDPMATTLEGPLFRAFNCVDPGDGGAVCSPQHVAMADMAGDFLPTEPDIDVAADNVQTEDEFAEVSVYYHADKFHQYLVDFGFAGTPCHTGGEPVTLVANYRVFLQGSWQPFDNAVYTGDCGLTLITGQGLRADWGYEGEVVYHELTHGFIEEQIGEGRFLGKRHLLANAVVTDAGAMNEAIADFMAAAHSGNPEHAEYLVAFDTSQGRNADNDRTCAAGLVGESHGDSQVFAGALWDGYVALGEPFVPLVLDMVAMLPEDALFEEASAILVELTSAAISPDAGAELESILTARALMACERVVPFEAFAQELWLRPKSLPDLFSPMRPPPYQITFEVPDDADTVEIEFVVVVITPPGWDPLADVNVLVKHDQPITFSYGMDEDTVTVEADSDQHIAGLNDGHALIPVTPGETLYAGFFNLGIHTAILSNLEVTFSNSGATGTSDMGTTDESSGTTGEDAGGDRSNGCGCRTPAGGGGLLWAIGLLVLSPRPRRGNLGAVRLS